ncbi:hypothetical protein TcasGA2_TC012452 [Tribolium castaneum]|uniref:Uncharacterized protein n=1 Tax=Tribolium castaneum TaxID=7070 RepID=D6X2D7_TRICA|nr:hypothetical protein TcasGA2_TC012452 [Tribolium castaneum]
MADVRPGGRRGPHAKPRDAFARVYSNQIKSGMSPGNDPHLPCRPKRRTETYIHLRFIQTPRQKSKDNRANDADLDSSSVIRGRCNSACFFTKAITTPDSPFLIYIQTPPPRS